MRGARSAARRRRPRTESLREPNGLVNKTCRGSVPIATGSRRASITIRSHFEDREGFEWRIRGARARVLAQARGNRHEPVADAEAQLRGGCGSDHSRKSGVSACRTTSCRRDAAAQGHLDLDEGTRCGGQEGRQGQRDCAAARLGELRREHLDLQDEVRPRDG